MPNAANVGFRTTDLTPSVSAPVTGINFVMGTSIRGPFDDPSDIINSWPKFVEKFGGLSVNTDTPLLCKRLLEKGGAIRFCRVGHYADPSSRSSLDATFGQADAEFVNDENTELFELVPKYPGADNNNFTVEVTSPSNGAEGFFNLIIKHNIERDIVEEYRNLRITENVTAENQDFLEEVVTRSKFFNVVYKDLSNETDPMVPENILVNYTGGSDGTPPVAADYIGDSTGRNGFHAFDEYDDSYNLAVFDSVDDAVLIAGSAYAAAREDLIYFLEIPHDVRTKSAIINKKQSLNIDSRHTYIFAGGLKINDPITGQLKEIPGIADVLALENATSNNYGPWYSFAGINRGNITNALGVVNNFGAAGNFRDLNDLANQQINMIINRDHSIKLWGNFSAQLATTQQSQLSIVRLIIYLKKSLRTPLESYLEEPNDIPTWKRIYYTVLPFLDSLVTQRALFEYEWQGDQFAKSLDDLKVNDKTDVSNGKYKILFPIKAIPSLQEIMVHIILTPAGIDFTTAGELI